MRNCVINDTYNWFGGESQRERSKRKIKNGTYNFIVNLPAKGRCHSEETKRKIGNARKGRSWYNNGTTNFRLHPDDGRIPSLTKGKKLYDASIGLFANCNFECNRI